jgi:hypothetical protein
MAPWFSAAAQRLWCSEAWRIARYKTLHTESGVGDAPRLFATA